MKIHFGSSNMKIQSKMLLLLVISDAKLIPTEKLLQIPFDILKVHFILSVCT